ncbi:cytochrome c oxidase assembly factor 3, mitochondrial [Anoplophora glabripennis]|uniref:cytochrome c oxidase assembly factor 3, mitochondrial n=1 Tax=Anoplophora glabripennis TaxID=217634 RepID=UPI00087594F2|nr:cytochrome c oxidase assembly factor 3, mitochondrial [Anoplophora glabripennis]XP_018563540.1 cytochrome c oxidase assembly factor 3, mitochondrial [Anoplophora glabripennis]
MSDRMPKIDISKLKQTDVHFIKEVEKKNIDRVQKLMRIRKNNLITASLLGIGVLSIYGYTMYAVRQESFLDDFDEPAKTTK